MPAYTLQDCLRIFSSKETLDGDNRPVCARCRRRRKSAKRLAIHRFPPVLVIHLKRFQCDSTSREKVSTAVEFPTSGLDLMPYSTPGAGPSGDVRNERRDDHGDSSRERQRREASRSSGAVSGESDSGKGERGKGEGLRNRHRPVVTPVYELYGVCNHMGGLGGGHYTAHCGSRSNSAEWHTFDDARVTRVNTARVVGWGTSAYVLFYRLVQPE